jgi:CHAD domain-containing protein
MPFCFKRKESVSKAIRRLGRERIEDALECLKDCSDGEATHSARKDIKKVRAVLRLVRAEIKGKEFRQVTKPLREAAKHLAAQRDAYVRVKTVKSLIGHFKGQLADGALRAIRAELRSTFEEELRRVAKERKAKAVEQLLRRAAKQLEHLNVRGKGWKALSHGVKTTYADGQRAYQVALESSSAEDFHKWRKRAKDLWYQVTLLRRVWPEQIDAMVKELEMLGEYLGDDHDLVMLQQALNERCAGEKHLRELKTLAALIEERHRELRTAALALGARFYAEKPSAFCNRLAGYWQIWRREKTPIAQSADARP